MVTILLCTTRFIIQQFYILPAQCIYVFCVDLRTNSLYFPYNINWLVCIIETQCVYCAVRTGSLKTVMVNLCFGPVSNPSKSVWIFGQKSVTRTGFSSSIYVPSCQCHYIPLHQNTTLTFIDVLLLPEEQMGEVWEPSKTQCYSGNNGRKIHI